jgi:hypothetical protein
MHARVLRLLPYLSSLWVADRILHARRVWRSHPLVGSARLVHVLGVRGGSLWVADVGSGAGRGLALVGLHVLLGGIGAEGWEQWSVSLLHLDKLFGSSLKAGRDAMGAVARVVRVREDRKNDIVGSA